VVLYFLGRWRRLPVFQRCQQKLIFLIAISVTHCISKVTFVDAEVILGTDKFRTVVDLR
jgi:hypothetical protein